MPGISERHIRYLDKQIRAGQIHSAFKWQTHFLDVDVASAFSLFLL